MATLEVKTEIAGTVWKLVSKVGDALGEDDEILILESMKMEIPVSAPEEGVIKELLVGEGDIVAEGAVVARLEV